MPESVFSPPFGEQYHFSISVTKYDHKKRLEKGHPVTGVIRFIINRDTVLSCGGFLQAALGSRGFQFSDTGNDSISLDDDNLMTMEVVLRVLHGSTAEGPSDIVIATAWGVVAMLDRYRIVDLKNEHLRDEAEHS